MMTTLHDLVRHVAPRSAAVMPDGVTPIGRITADSRAVQPGDVFVAVPGERFDGHDYAADAVQRGAVAVVGTRDASALPELPGTVPYLQVDDARAALAAGSALLQGFPSRALTVIGVTGTDGKTTTSSLLEAILVEATRAPDAPAGSVGVVSTLGARIAGRESDTGLHVTTPDASEVQQFLADMRDAGCRFAVVESTSHGLHQQRVGAVEYDVAVVTNITHEHLDYHGTRDAYVAAKALLFRALYRSEPKPGVARAAVLNADDAGSYDALRAALAEEEVRTGRRIPTRAYGLGGPAGTPDLYAADVVYRPDRTTFTLHWWGGAPFAVESRLIGDFNLYNVMAAATAALALGLEPARVARGIAAFPGVLGRMERMERGQEFLAIVDFAHSPASLERALLTLRPLVGRAPDGTPGRLIAVFGSAGLRDRAKRRWMGQVSGRLADFTVVTAEDPRTEDVNEICREIAAGVAEFVGPERYAVRPDRTEAIQYAVDMARAGDIVAAFGKGHERSMCYGEIEYPWSDQDAMLGALDRRATA